MSRVRVWCELVCRTCATAAPGRWCTGQIPKRQMILRAKEQGWCVQDGEMFCCEKCLETYKKELADSKNVEHNSEHGRG